MARVYYMYFEAVHKRVQDTCDRLTERSEMMEKYGAIIKASELEMEAQRFMDHCEPPHSKLCGI